MRWTKEKDPLAPRNASPVHGGTVLSLFALLASVLTLCSFFLFDATSGTGDVSRAVSYFEEFFSENDAVAVFLGWEGQD